MQMNQPIYNYYYVHLHDDEEEDDDPRLHLHLSLAHGRLISEISLLLRDEVRPQRGLQFCSADGLSRILLHPPLFQLDGSER